MLTKNFKKYFPADDKLIASYEWVRNPFHKTPEGLSIDEEEKFIDFTTSGETKIQFRIGIAFTSTLGQIILDEYFEKYLSSASGLSFAGGSLGTFVFSFVLQKSIDLYGLSNTFVFMGVMTLFVVPLAFTLVKPPPWVTQEEGRGERSFIKGRFFVVDSFWPTLGHLKKKKPVEQTESSVVISDKQSSGTKSTHNTTIEVESEKSENNVATMSIEKTGSPTTFKIFSKNNTSMAEKDFQNAAEEDAKITVEGQRSDIDSKDGSNETLCSNVSGSSIYHQASDGSFLSGEKTGEITADDTRCSSNQSFTDRASREMFEAEKFIEEDTSSAVSRLERKLDDDASPTIEKQPFIIEKYVLKKVKPLEPATVFTPHKDGVLKQTEAIQNMDESQEKWAKGVTQKKEDIEKLHREEQNSEGELTFRSRSPMPSPEAVKEFAVKKFLKKKIESAEFNSPFVSSEASNPNFEENKGAKPKIPSAKRSLGGNKKKHRKGKGSQKYTRSITQNPSFDVECGEPFTQPKQQTRILDSGLAGIEEPLSREDDRIRNVLETNDDENFPSSSKTDSLFFPYVQSFDINFIRRHIHDVILVLNIKCVVASDSALKHDYGSIIGSKDGKFLEEMEELLVSIEREIGSFDSEDRNTFRRKSSLYPRLRDIFKKSDRYIVSHFEDERREHFGKLVCELRGLYDYVKEPLTLSSQQISLQPEESSSCWPPFIHQVIFKLYLNPAFLIICLCRAVHLMTFMGVLTFIVDFAMDRGLKESDARYSVTMMSLGDLLGRLCTGWITDTRLISLEKYMLLAMGLIGVISVCFPYLPANTLLPFICIYSLLQGSVFIRHPVLVSKYTSSEERTVGMGFMTLFSGLLGFLMPFYIGHYRDEIGTYNHIFFINGGICLGIGLLWMLESWLKKYAV
nr:uncharacterized protein LOC122268275 [Parasteatoda tepidariorum]